MNAERQLIGSLLIDNARYDDVSFLKASMFYDPELGEIYRLFEQGKLVNPITVAQEMPYIDTESLLQDLVTEHDASISDSYCAQQIFNEYKARELDKAFDHIQVNAKNVDKVADELASVLENLQREDTDSEVKTLAELTEYSGNYFNPKNEKRIKLGFEKLDKAIGGFDGGDVTIIAARPGVGKSALALQAIRKFGRDGLKTGYFNLEMSAKQIYERSVASSSGIELNRIRLGTNFLNNEQDLFAEGNAKMQEEKNVFTISGMQTIKNIRQIQKKYRFDVIVIDYLQLIKTEGRRNGSRAAEVGDISRGLKAIASDFNIPVIALSQLNRVSEMNKDREPSMSELRESGDLEQDASTILMLWNPNRENPKEKMIKVEKSRNGVTDRMPLYFDGKHMTFSSIDFSEDFKSADDMEDIPFDI